MKAFNKYIYISLFILLLMMLTAGMAGCERTAVTPSITSPAEAPPAPAPAEPILLKIEIIEGPSGSIESNTVTFRWSSTSSSNDSALISSIKYASYLQGYDRDYTSFLPDTSRTFSNLPPGAYIFYVKGQDSAGDIESEPASRSFTVSAKAPEIALVEPTPSVSGGQMLIGGDVSRIAVCGDILYALNVPGGRLYRSDSGGLGWTDISGKVGGGFPWVDIAVAPDDPGMIAVATDGGREVYVSADSGLTFNPTGLSAAIGAGRVARCIAISCDYGSPKREIAAGLWDGATGGGVMVNILSNFPSGWLNMGITGVDIAALKYSPSFLSDGTLLAIASSATKTYLFMGLRDLGSNTTAWNTSPGYPVELGLPGTGSAGTPLNYADISLPSDFDGSSAQSRHVIASWSKSHPGQDVYHVYDAQAYRMNAPEPIATVSYYGSSLNGKLLLGAAKCRDSSCYTVQTYFAGNPFANTPSAPIWQPSQKPPTGSRDVRVAWSANGRMAFAGTSGTEAALSHSRDNGRTWNQ